jgi:hypothetical protein
MTETDSVNLFYLGAEGEGVTVTVTEQNTVFAVTYRLDGKEKVLKKGDKINFKLDSSKTIELRMVFDFANESGTGGSYRVVLTGSAGGTFAKTWKQFGNKPKIKTYGFDAQ